MVESRLKADARVELRRLVAVPRVLLHKRVRRAQGRLGRAVRRMRRLRLRFLGLPLAVRGVADEADVAVRQLGRRTSRLRRNSDAERSLLSAPAQAVVHGVSGRRDCPL